MLSRRLSGRQNTFLVASNQDRAPLQAVQHHGHQWERNCAVSPQSTALSPGLPAAAQLRLTLTAPDDAQNCRLTVPGGCDRLTLTVLALLSKLKTPAVSVHTWI